MNGSFTVLLNEQHLVQQAAIDPEAFVAIYDHYFPRVYTYIRYRVNEDATADDLTAFVFERALSRIDTYQPERAPFSAWLFGIARHAVGNYYRRKKRWQFLPLDMFLEHPARTTSPDEIVAHQETEAQLLDAVSKLGERERDLIALKFAADLTNRRIADITGLSESNVAVIIHRALKQLKVELEKE